VRLAGFIGGSHTNQSVSADAQRCVNLYPEMNEVGTGKEGDVGCLIGTPGLKLYGTVGSTGSVRGAFTASNNVLYVVILDTFYRVNSNNTLDTLGTLQTTSGIVSMADNGLQIFVVDGSNGYIFTIGLGLFQDVTDPDFVGADKVTFQDGFFILNKPGTAQFYITSLYDGFNIDSLDFATAEGAPDKLISLLSDHRELWLFGEASIEVYFNSGNPDFPFERIEGAYIEQGCLATHSVAKLSGNVFWLGSDRSGGAVIFSASGYVPTRISTHAVELSLQALSDLTGAVAFTYQQEGHEFYVLNVPGLNTTWVYDTTTQFWHERAFLNNGVLERHRAGVHSYAYGKHIVGDYAEPILYEWRLDTYEDEFGEGCGDASLLPGTGPFGGGRVLAGHGNAVVSLMSISITPVDPIVYEEETRQFLAIGTYSDASMADLTALVTWVSSFPSFVTINAAGLATGVANGAAIITATLGVTVSNQVTVSVLPFQFHQIEQSLVVKSGTTAHSISIDSVNKKAYLSLDDGTVSVVTYSPNLSVDSNAGNILVDIFGVHNSAFNSTFDAFVVGLEDYEPTPLFYAHIRRFLRPAYVFDSIVPYTTPFPPDTTTPLVGARTLGFAGKGDVGILVVMNKDTSEVHYAKMDLAGLAQVGAMIQSNVLAGGTNAFRNILFSEDENTFFVVRFNSSIEKCTLSPFSVGANASIVIVPSFLFNALAVGAGAIYVSGDSPQDLYRYSQSTLVQTAVNTGLGSMGGMVVSESLNALFISQEGTVDALVRLDPVTLIQTGSTPFVGIEGFDTIAIDDELGVAIATSGDTVVRFRLKPVAIPSGFSYIDSIVVRPVFGTPNFSHIDPVGRNVYATYFSDNGDVRILNYASGLSLIASTGSVFDGFLDENSMTIDADFYAYTSAGSSLTAIGYYAPPSYLLMGTVPFTPPFGGVPIHVRMKTSGNFGVLDVTETGTLNRFYAQMDLTNILQVGAMIPSLLPNNATPFSGSIMLFSEDGQHVFMCRDGISVEKLTRSPFATTGVMNTSLPVTLQWACIGGGFIYAVNGGDIYKISQQTLLVVQVVTPPTSSTRMSYSQTLNKLFAWDYNTNTLARFDAGTLAYIDGLFIPGVSDTFDDFTNIQIDDNLLMAICFDSIGRAHRVRIA